MIFFLKNYQHIAKIVQLNLQKNIMKFFFGFFKKWVSASTFKNQQSLTNGGRFAARTTEYCPVVDFLK